MRRRKANAVAPVGDDGGSDAQFDVNVEWGKIMQGESAGYKPEVDFALRQVQDGNAAALTAYAGHGSRDGDVGAQHLPSDSPRGALTPRKITVVSAATVEQSHDELVSLSAEMRELFSEIKKQFLEYKNKHTFLAEAVKCADVTKVDLETKVEDLEDENAQLQLALTKGLENRHSAPARNHATSATDHMSSGENIIGLQQGGEDIRRVLLDQDDINELEESAADVETVFNVRRRISRWIERHTPFELENRKLHATFGGAVAAYFLFLRWMFMNFLLIGAIAAAISVLHIINMVVDNRGGDVLTGGNVLPGFMLISTFQPDERVLYSTTVIVMILTLCILGLKKLITEDVNKKRHEIMETGKEAVYSKLLLVGWDNSLVSHVEAAQHSGSLAALGRELLAATQSMGEKQARTNLEAAILFLRRFVGFMAYGAMQFGCYVLIAYLTVKSHSIQQAANNIGFLKFFAPSIVPAVVTAINSTTPTIILSITLFERWESGQTEVNIRILRMFLSRILNILVLALAYGFLADPFLMADEDSQDIRKAVEIKFSDGFECRLNQTGDGMMSLVFTDLVISMFVLYGFNVGSKIFARCLNQEWIKYEFDTASTMVSVLYFAGLIVLTLPFTPLSLIFSPIMLALRFKWEAWVSSNYSSKPKKPWQVHAAGRTFTIFYLITLVFIGVSSSFFFLGKNTFAKSCDIQDDNVMLCLGSLNPVTEVCTIDPSSKFYSLYSDENYCSGGYPYCLCHKDLACGPFIHEDIALNPFANRVDSLPFLGFIWDYFIVNSYGTWVLVGFLFIFASLRYNSFRVTKTAKVEKEAQFLAHIASLQAEQKRQQKIINRLRILEGSNAPQPGVSDAAKQN